MLGIYLCCVYGDRLEAGAKFDNAQFQYKV
jgi:hypothetical protein